MSARRLAAAAAALLALAAVALPDFEVTLLNYVGLYAIVALGLVLVTGIAGLTSVGHAAFVGVAAYTTAVLTTSAGFSPWATLPISVALTAAAALVIGVLTLRLSGHYFVLGTIAWSIALYIVFGNVAILGGYNGLSGVPPLSLGGRTLDGSRGFFAVIWTAAALALAAVSNLLDSRLGRALRVVSRPTLAEALGIHSSNLKILAFVYSAVLAGLAGWLHAHYLRFVNPGPFGVNASIEYLFMVVIGGASHVGGAFIGAGIVTFLRTWLQDWLPKLVGSAGQFEVIVFGALVVLLIHHASAGVMPRLAALLPARRRTVADAAALPRRARPAPGEPLLELRAATKAFGGLTAVSRVSFGLAGGEIVGLIGPNGAGKTTTFNLVTGLLAPDDGEIRFRGERIDALPAREILRRGVARTFQLVHLHAGMTVLENVALGAHTRGTRGVLAASLHAEREEERRLLAEAARQVRRVGLEERMHDPAGKLPLGQQRIVEIARALCADPVLLLLDEPGAGLRYQEKRALVALLRSLKDEGLSILLVEHDMELVMAVADRLVVMDFGQKIAEGPPQAIQQDPAVIEAYLGA